MDFLEKLRKQPEHVRKIILWTTVIIIGLILSFFWIKEILKNIEEVKSSPSFIPKLELDENMPEIPKLPEQELKQLEEEINNAR